MKKFFFLFSLVVLLAACGKDKEPERPIDKFIGEFKGDFREYKCSDTLIVENTFENYRVITTEKSENSITGKLLNEAGKTVFNFIANLEADKNSEIRITNFKYGSETLFGPGKIISGKLNLQFATDKCPTGGNSYRVTREFSQK